MIKLFLVGIGSGNPDHITLQAIRTLNSVDLILIPDKGGDKADLADLRRAICAEVITNPAVKLAEFAMPVRDASNADYRQSVEDWHDAIADVWLATIRAQLGDEGRVALMVWGDPSLYDSTLRIAERVGRKVDLKTSVIAGITSLQALTAAFAMPLNAIGAPVLITTGRHLREHGFPEGVDTVAVMLDGSCSFRHLPPQGLSIYWGACVGLENQVTRSGRLTDVGAEIIATRAQLRAQHGWVMDIYILKRG